MIEMFFVEKDEDVTLKRLLQKILIGAPICILLGAKWIKDAIREFGAPAKLKYSLAQEGFDLITIAIMVVGIFLVYYGIKLIVQSVRAYSKLKQTNSK